MLQSLLFCQAEYEAIQMRKRIEERRSNYVSGSAGRPSQIRTSSGQPPRAT